MGLLPGTFQWGFYQVLFNGAITRYFSMGLSPSTFQWGFEYFWMRAGGVFSQFHDYRQTGRKHTENLTLGPLILVSKGSRNQKVIPALLQNKRRFSEYQMKILLPIWQTAHVDVVWWNSLKFSGQTFSTLPTQPIFPRPVHLSTRPHLSPAVHIPHFPPSLYTPTPSYPPHTPILPIPSLFPFPVPMPPSFPACPLSTYPTPPFPDRRHLYRTSHTRTRDKVSWCRGLHQMINSDGTDHGHPWDCQYDL